MSLVWTYDSWEGRWPSTGSDEWYRHTVVLPIPFTRHQEHGVFLEEEEDYDAWRAIVIVVRPWWLCHHALKRDYRAHVRWQRGMEHALRDSNWFDYVVSDPELADALFDRTYDEYCAAAGPQPELP